jgi:hypothetical protein
MCHVGWHCPGRLSSLVLGLLHLPLLNRREPVAAHFHALLYQGFLQGFVAVTVPRYVSLYLLLYWLALYICVLAHLND